MKPNFVLFSQARWSKNGIFSYVERNNYNSEVVDGNEQCSSNVKETPPPKRTKCN